MIYKSETKPVAVLPTGQHMSYDEYTGKNGHKMNPCWERVREARHKLDNGCCGFCKVRLDKYYQCHHLTYDRLGQERLSDVITLCNKCHKGFHDQWNYVNFWEKEDENHWENWSLSDTAKLCKSYLERDYWFGGDLNCLDLDVCASLIDDYFTDNEITDPVMISPTDVQLFFRNKRYEVLFEAESKGVVLKYNTLDEAGDAFLDERFGKKGGKGGNPYRSKARQFMLNHDGESFHRNYSALRHINQLMEEVRK